MSDGSKRLSVVRYAVLRVPSSGPPALIAPPNNFASEAEAESRIAEIERRKRMTHHTHLETFAYEGDLSAALAVRGVLR
ncbi:MAG: hypothetical protein AAGF90_13940 [Pseudomonadota bacterium]